MAVAWEDVEAAATKMFNVWTSGGDLAFAKEAWDYLEASGLTEDDSFANTTRVYLRLVTLSLICREFSDAKWDEKADMPISYLVEDLEVDRLALGLMAAPHMTVNDWEYANEFDMSEAALMAATDTLRPEIMECLRQAYGGDTDLYKRLSQMSSNGNDRDFEDFDPSSTNVDAYDFVKQGGHR